MRVLLGIPAGRGDTRLWQEDALYELTRYSRERGVEVSPPAVQSGAYIAENRNRLLSRAHREGYDACFMLDSDMVPPPAAVVDLLSLEVPLASGLCFLGGFPYVPSAFVLLPPEERDERFAPPKSFYEWPLLPFRTLDPIPEEPFEVDAVGGACLMIRREVWERLAPRPFWLIYTNEQYLPEDLLFCLRYTEEFGSLPVVHPGVEVGHLRPVPIGRTHWLTAKRQLKEREEKGEVTLPRSLDDLEQLRKREPA